MAYVIRAWKADNQPIDGQKNYVVIHARKAGLVAFILTALGVETDVTMKVNAKRFELHTKSVFGFHRRQVPLEMISSTDCGHGGPGWQAAAVFVAAFFVAVWCGVFLTYPAVENRPWMAWLVLGFSAVAAAGVALVYYVLNKTFFIRLVECSSFANVIAFKPSLIEDVVIDEDDARLVCDLIQGLVEHRLAGRRPATP